MNQVIDSILKRRSTRVFGEGDISKETLEEIIQAGLYAPSAMNQQPWHFTVVRGKELLDELSHETKEMAKKHELEYIRNYAKNEKFQIFYNAPVAIIISGEEKAYEAAVDCAAATENILLAAEALDIGSCWIGFISFLFSGDEETARKYREKLGIPEGYKPLHGIALGPKKLGNLPAPKRRENTVNYIG